MEAIPDILNDIPELEPTPPAEQFLGDGLFFYILTGVSAGVLLLLLLVVILWYRAAKKPAAAPSQQELALKALAELEQETPDMRSLSLRLSLILREFLTGQTQDPALFETHEEFSQRMDALASVPQECRFETHTLLESLVNMKYSGANSQDPVRAKGLIEQARTLVTRITTAQQKEAAEAAARGQFKP